MAKNIPLRGLVYSKFATAADMATAMGWSKQKLSNVMRGRKEPDLKDVHELASVLGVSFMDVAQIFLHKESPTGDE